MSLKNIILIIVLFISYSSYAKLGETMHDFNADRFYINTYLNAHGMTLTKRIMQYNSKGLKRLLKGIKRPADQKLVNKHIANSSMKDLLKIEYKNNHYEINSDEFKIHFKNTDLLLDRIFINNKKFELKNNEDLVSLRMRIHTFLKRNTYKKTSSVFALFF